MLTLLAAGFLLGLGFLLAIKLWPHIWPLLRWLLIGCAVLASISAVGLAIYVLWLLLADYVDGFNLGCWLFIAVCVLSLGQKYWSQTSSTPEDLT